MPADSTPSSSPIPTAALLALTGAPPRSNEEVMDASTWPPRALEAAGVQFVVPWGARKDLELAKSASGLQMYRTAHPAPRNYLRPNSDVIEVRSSSHEPGVVHVLEAYDPGWTATIDGSPAPVLKANPLGMEVAAPAGDHLVRLAYRTPGRTVGMLLSLASIGLFALFLMKF